MRRLLIPIFLLLLSTGRIAFAQENHYELAIPDPDLFKEVQFQLAPEFAYITYREPDYNIKEKGPYFGISASYEWRPYEAQTWVLDVLHFDDHVDFGTVDYRSAQVQVNNISDVTTEPRLWVGRDFSPWRLTRITPYAGLGYRLLYDNLGKVSQIGGYDRLSQYFYAPVGFEIYTGAVDGWQFGFSAEYDIFIRGWQRSYLSDVSDAYPDLKNTQGKGYGLRASFEIVKKLYHVNLFISPYIRYWNVRKSKTTTAVNNSSGIEFIGFEPNNNSTETGVKIGVQF